MSTTTLRSPEELKARIAKLAEKSGKTAHSVHRVMLDAIGQKVEEEEPRASCHAEAVVSLHAELDTVFVLDVRSRRELGFANTAR